MLPYELASQGVKTFHCRERGRSPTVARKKKKMVTLLRDRELRRKLREETAAKEEARLAGGAGIGMIGGGDEGEEGLGKDLTSSEGPASEGVEKEDGVEICL